jgi:hypothetical protein
MVEPEEPQMTSHYGACACWISKVTYANSLVTHLHTLRPTLSVFPQEELYADTSQGYVTGTLLPVVV